MKKIIMAAIIVVAMSDSAMAGTAFLIGETTGVIMKTCFYNYIGDTVAITIKSTKLCPLSIKV